MKLMFDECFLRKKLRRQLSETEGYDVVTCLDLGFKEGENDKELVQGTVKHDRLLVTVDFRTITEEKYPPCKHGGILRFERNKVSDNYVYQRLEALHTLKLEERAVGHFTYLTDDGIKIVTHKEIIERNFDDYEELRNIERG